MAAKKKPTVKKSVRKTKSKRNSKVSSAVSQALHPEKYLSSVVDGDDKEMYWEEVDALYNTIASSLLELSARVKEMFDSTGIIERLSDEDKAKLNVYQRAFYKDIRQLADELKAVHEKHVQRTGKVSAKEDLFDFVGYFQEYLKIKDVLVAAIQPTYISMATILMTAIEPDEKTVKSMDEAMEVAVKSIQDSTAEGDSNE